MAQDTNQRGVRVTFEGSAPEIPKGTKGTAFYSDGHDLPGHIEFESVVFFPEGTATGYYVSKEEVEPIDKYHGPGREPDRVPITGDEAASLLIESFKGNRDRISERLKDISGESLHNLRNALLRLAEPIADELRRRHEESGQ